MAVFGIIVTAIVPFIGYVYKTRKEFRNYYSVIWKPSGKLKPKDLLGERPCEEFYFERNLDSFLKRAFERKRNALIVGPPLSGKTRSVYNALLNSKRKINVLSPRNVAMPVFKFPTDYFFWSDKLVFIDDIQYYIEKEDNYHLLFREAKNKGIPVIAACHSGREYKKVKNKLIEHNLDLDTLFGEDIIELDKIAPDEGKKVAEGLGKKWDNVKFNGTIGSIFMPLSEMDRRYDLLDKVEKTALMSIRNLYLCGVFSDNNNFKVEWIKKAASLNELEGKDFEWTAWLKSLEDKEFIKMTARGKIWAEDAYLEYVVKPDVEMTQLDIMEEMSKIFADNNEVLEMIGERAYDTGSIEANVAEYMRVVINAFESILKNIDNNESKPEFVKAQSYLGQAYWKLSRISDTVENCLKAMNYFNVVLKHINIDSNPTEFGRIKNRIGNTYTAFAEIQNKEQNCKVAINAYNEALKVFTIEKEPYEYARVCNNLGGAYLMLAEVSDPAGNYKRSIDLFTESLKVRTIDRYPKDYALTKNNIANTYAQLSQVEHSERHLKLAVNSYDDALKYNTKAKYPMQYGQIINNIGNAYSMLAGITNDTEYSRKAIAAYKQALEVRNPENAPIMYANTMINLGDAYLTLYQSDKNSENLYNAIDAVEDSLTIRQKDKYPQQYGTAQFELAKMYILLAGLEEKTENYHKAVKAFDEALEIFTESSHPEMHSKIQAEITKSKKIFF